MNKLYHDGDYQPPRGILEDKRENWFVTMKFFSVTRVIH